VVAVSARSKPRTVVPAASLARYMVGESAHVNASRFHHSYSISVPVRHLSNRETVLVGILYEARREVAKKLYTRSTAPMRFLMPRLARYFGHWRASIR